MEVLSKLIEEAALEGSEYQFRPKCAAVKLTHHCFADDVLLFSSANIHLVERINKVLMKLAELSSLRANPLKAQFSVLTFL
jgi:hypothetical protein